MKTSTSKSSKSNSKEVLWLKVTFFFHNNISKTHGIFIEKFEEFGIFLQLAFT